MCSTDNHPDENLPCGLFDGGWFFDAPFEGVGKGVHKKKRFENSLRPLSKDCLSILEWLTLPCYRWEAPLGSLSLGVGKGGCKCLNSACYDLMVLVGPLRATPTHFRWFAYPTAIPTDRFTLLTLWTFGVVWGHHAKTTQGGNLCLSVCLVGIPTHVLLKFQASTIFFLSFTDCRKKWCFNFFEQFNWFLHVLYNFWPKTWSNQSIFELAVS